MGTSLSRRTVVQGIVLAGSAAIVGTPAATAAGPAACSVAWLFEGGATINLQTLQIALQATTADGSAIAAGTTFALSLSVTTSALASLTAPTKTTSSAYSISVGAPTTSGSTRTWPITIKTNTTLASGNGLGSLIWTSGGSYLPANSQVTLTSAASAISFNVGSRYKTSVNDTRYLRPLRIDSYSGAQTCSPRVQFSRLTTNFNRDARVCLPAGGCQYATPAAGSAQMTVAAVC